MLDFIEKLFIKIPVGMRFMVWVGLAFLAALSFVHIDSVFADKHHINWLLWVLGLILSGIVVCIFIIANNENKDEKNQRLL